MQKITVDLLEDTLQAIRENRSEINIAILKELSSNIPGVDLLILLDANPADREYLHFFMMLNITCNLLDTIGIPLRPVPPELWSNCLKDSLYLFALSTSGKKRDHMIFDTFIEQYYQSDFLNSIFIQLEPKTSTMESLICYFRHVILIKSLVDALYLAHNNTPQPGSTIFLTEFEPSLTTRFKAHELMKHVFSNISSSMPSPVTAIHVDL
jgi:hypothetical protein